MISFTSEPVTGIISESLTTFIGIPTAMAASHCGGLLRLVHYLFKLHF